MSLITTIVLVLLSLLGARDYTTRERATAALRPLVELAPELILAAEKSPDPEIRERARQLLAPWFRRHAVELVEAMKPADGWPRIDSLPCGWDGLSTDEWEDRYREPVGMYFADSIPCYRHSAQEATRLWLVDRVTLRQPVGELLAVLIESERNNQRRRMLQHQRWEP